MPYGGRMNQEVSTDRVVLITGASSGFGKETASLLVQHGFRVFGTSRRASGEKQDGVEMLRLDITSDESVRDCVSTLLSKAGRIDVLVNNAGQVLTGGLEETSVEEAKAHFDSNFFGAVRMVDAVLPDMRKRRSGQIINVASLAGTFPVPFEGYYGAAKAALIAYSEVLRQEVKSLGVKVSVVEPGFFRTNLGNTRVAAGNRISDYDEMRKRAHAALAESFNNGGDPEDVADTIVKIIENPSPQLRYAVGKEKRYVFMRRILPVSMIESQARKHWRLDG
jgi:NAD(P)-dependent dehydrogenase (short-subunit alcohol dehydrogenase family)